MKNIFFNLKNRGFTLIELLVTIAIIGILSSFLLANFVGVRQRARDGVRKSDLRQIQSALELYRADQGEYPSFALTCGCALTSSTAEADCTVSPAGTVYMKKIACDPSTSASYQYDTAGGVTYCLRTCLENIKDGDIDEETSISGCSNLSTCDTDTQGSFTLQNP
jgi:type II secretion system protein G